MPVNLVASCDYGFKSIIEIYRLTTLEPNESSGESRHHNNNL